MLGCEIRCPRLDARFVRTVRSTVVHSVARMVILAMALAIALALSLLPRPSPRVYCISFYVLYHSATYSVLIKATPLDPLRLHAPIRQARNPCPVLSLSRLDSIY